MTSAQPGREQTRRSQLVTTAEGHHAGAFTPLDWGLAVTAGCVWGSSFFFIAEGLEAFEPTLITFLRILFGFGALGCVRAARRATIDPHDRPRLVLLGVVWMAIPLSVFPFAEQHVSSAVTGMLNGGLPIFVATIASILLRRLPGRLQIVGISIGFVGLVLIGLPTAAEGSSSAFGIGLILLALLCYGVAYNVAIPLQHRYGSLAVLWRVQAVALVLTAPFGVAGVAGSSFAWKPALAVAALGVGGTALAYVAAATLGGRVGSTRGSITTYLIPPVSIFLGVAFRGEELYALAALGTAVVLLGAWVASRAEDRGAAVTLRAAGGWSRSRR